jgi:hypothetical protein
MGRSIQAPLWIALPSSGLAAWLVGATMVLVPASHMLLWGIYPSVAVVLYGPLFTVAAMLFVALPAHHWLTRRGAGLGGYVLAGSVTGAASGVFAAALAAFDMENAHRPWFWIFEWGLILVVPGIVAGLAAAVTLWALRRPRVRPGSAPPDLAR